MTRSLKREENFGRCKPRTINVGFPINGLFIEVYLFYNLFINKSCVVHVP